MMVGGVHATSHMTNCTPISPANKRVMAPPTTKPPIGWVFCAPGLPILWSILAGFQTEPGNLALRICQMDSGVCANLIYIE